MVTAAVHAAAEKVPTLLEVAEDKVVDLGRPRPSASRRRCWSFSLGSASRKFYMTRGSLNVKSRPFPEPGWGRGTHGSGPGAPHNRYVSALEGNSLLRVEAHVALHQGHVGGRGGGGGCAAAYSATHADKHTDAAAAAGTAAWGAPAAAAGKSRSGGPAERGHLGAEACRCGVGVRLDPSRPLAWRCCSVRAALSPSASA